MRRRAAKLPTGKRLTQFLRDNFGIEELREGQEPVVRSVLAQKHTLAVMPTGAGKSLCYQLPALIMPGTTIVVSPLIALMKDQKEKLEDLDIKAVQLNSSLSAKDRAKQERRASRGKAEFVYVTPERVTNPDFIASMKNNVIDLFVLDEAHCLSQWGHDFRPAYLDVKKAWAALGKPPVLALTATATIEVIDDLQEQLGLNFEVFQSGVLRPNLIYETRNLDKAEDKDAEVLRLIQGLAEGSAIVYCATIKAVEHVHEFLKSAGIEAECYHGKMRAADRGAAQDRFMSGQSRLMIATNAFGMGIDKRDIRLVVHYAFPATLEAYYQESGRAGRDGFPSRCVLLYLKKDKCTQNFFMAGRYPEAPAIAAVHRVLEESEGLVSAAVIHEKTGVAKAKVAVILSALREEGVIKAGRQGYKLASKGLSFSLSEKILEKYRRKKESDHDKLKAMIVYGQTSLCRWKMILKYFGQDIEWERCEHCDNCAKPASRIVTQTQTPAQHATV